MSGQAGARAPPAAPRAGSSAPGSATGLPTGAPNARATGWRLETASSSSAQVRSTSRGLWVEDPAGMGGAVSGTQGWSQGPSMGGTGFLCTELSSGSAPRSLFLLSSWLSAAPSPGRCVSASCGSRTCPCLAAPLSGWEVAGLGVVGRLQCHMRGRHAAPGTCVLRSLLRGSSLPGPAG